MLYLLKELKIVKRGGKIGQGGSLQGRHCMEVGFKPQVLRAESQSLMNQSRTGDNVQGPTDLVDLATPQPPSANIYSREQHLAKHFRVDRYY
jgi:hypothetical protein